MKIWHLLIWGSTLAVLIVGWELSAYAATRVICPPGNEVSTTKSVSGTIVECLGKKRSTKRTYMKYTPCKPPGRYFTRDEVPSGRDRGTDRCTAAGLSGPSLPCGVGLKREIVRGGVDKCYFQRGYELVYTDFLICSSGGRCR
jgi:hypothetical protein